MPEIDPRIVRVGVQVGAQLKIYEGLALRITGMRYANSIQNECEVQLFNVDKPTQDYLLTATSPYNLNRQQKICTVDAGRVSYGTTRVFYGNIVSATVSQPPDINISLKCLTSNYLKGNILSRYAPATSSFQQISQGVANDLSLTLNFQADDKNIANYHYSGAALKQVDLLGKMGAYDAFIDNNELIVKNSNRALTQPARILNIETGMIGIPELTEQGVKVRYLLDNQSRIGGALQIESKQYPAANGLYTIYKLGFEIANRDTPFYYVAEGKRQR